MQNDANPNRDARSVSILSSRDPLTRLLMRADGVTPVEMHRLRAMLRERAAAPTEIATRTIEAASERGQPVRRPRAQPG